MEENINKKGATPDSKETVTKEQAMAQIQAVMKQANDRTQQIVEQARQLEQMVRDKTIDNLFSVLKYEVHFEPTFVKKCAIIIAEYLNSIINTPEEKEEPVTE